MTPEDKIRASFGWEPKESPVRASTTKVGSVKRQRKIGPSRLFTEPKSPMQGPPWVPPQVGNQEYYVVVNGVLKIAKFVSTEPEDPEP